MFGVGADMPPDDGWSVDVVDAEAIERAERGLPPPDPALLVPHGRVPMPHAASRTVVPLSASSNQNARELSKTLPAPSRARLAELARGLDRDWWKCYLFVRDNVEFSLYRGLLRGPDRTLLDGRGNDADQALLLLALLQASGYDDATIVHAAIQDNGSALTEGFLLPLLPTEENPYCAASWLGISTNGTVEAVGQRVVSELVSAGLDCGRITLNGVCHVALEHFWVRLIVEGEVVDLDPSVKPTASTIAEGRVRNPAADMGYARNDLLGMTGRSWGSSRITKVSISGISAYFKKLVIALRKRWNGANVSAASYLRRWGIVPQKPDDGQGLHGIVVGTPEDALEGTPQPIESFRTKVRIRHGSTTVADFALDEVGDRMLWVSCDFASGGFRMTLYLDGTVLRRVSVGLASSSKLEISVGGRAHSYRFAHGTGNVYAIPVGFDGDAHGRTRKWFSDMLVRLRKTGGRRMTAAMLQVAGQQYHAQCSLVSDVRNSLFGRKSRQIYNVGLVASEGSMYLDMANRMSSMSDDSMTAFHSVVGDMLFESALEHAVLDQLNGTNVAVSTVRALSLANGADVPLYFVASNNFARVCGSLTNYTASVLAGIQSVCAAGGSALVPQNGRLRLNSWSGYGYAAYLHTSARSFGLMKIAGGFNGGYTSIALSPDVARTMDATVGTLRWNGAVQSPVQGDPVAMPAGAFLDRRTDLSLKGGLAPLEFVRNYDSRLRDTTGELGRGWFHNYELSVVETSDSDAAMGGGSVEAVLPTVVALTVVEDLMSALIEDPDRSKTANWDKKNALYMLVAALTAQWWSEQVVGNSVSVNLGDESLRFHRKVDGGYAPAPGVTATLTQSGRLYRLVRRLGETYLFNRQRRLASVIDRNGNATHLTYTSKGVLKSVSDGFGRSLTFTSGTNGLITRVQDNAGRNVFYSYNVTGCLTNVKDAASKSWRNDYHASSLALVSQVDPDGVVTVVNRYNVFGQVTNQISDIGQPWTYGYVWDAAAWNENPLGHRFTQAFDALGRVVQTVDRDGSRSSCRYDGHGHLVRREDASGRIETRTFDRRDNCVRRTTSADGESLVVGMGYDADNRLIALTNEAGYVTRFYYDCRHNLLRTRFPDGSSVTNAWTTNGLRRTEVVLSATRSRPRIAAYAYTRAGCLKRTTITGSYLSKKIVPVVTNTYDACGRRVSEKNAVGHTTLFRYGRTGKLLAVVDPMKGVTTNVYSRAGHLRTSRDPLGHVTQYVYTGSGKVASVTYPDGGVETNVYDAADNLVETVDPRGGFVRYVRDPVGRVLECTTAAGTERFSYDAAGNLVRTEDASGVVVRMAYDGFGRRTHVIDALGNTNAVSYNRLGLPVSATDPLGRTTRTTYDRLGRPQDVIRPSGATESFRYNSLGIRMGYTNAEGRVYGESYDACGRRVRAVDATRHQVYSNGYTRIGTCTRRLDGDGVLATFAYDKCQRMLRRTCPGGTDGFVYDRAGNLTRATNAVAREAFAYDACDRLVGAVTEVGGVAYTNVWARDLGGLVTNRVYAPGESVSCSYDRAGRLAEVRDWLGHVWTFTWDGAGRLLRLDAPGGASSTRTYDAAGRLVAWSAGTLGGRLLALDAAGRRVQEVPTAGVPPVPARTRSFTLAYDAANRPVSGTVAWSSTGGTVRAEIAFSHNGSGALRSAVVSPTVGAPADFAATYDALGRLTSLGGEKVASDACGNRVRALGRIWIPDHADPLKRPLLECDAEGHVLRRYLWAGGLLLGFVDAAGTLTVAHTDDRGSVVALTSESGDVLFRANWGPHGGDWGMAGLNPTPFGWLGGYGVMRVGGADNVLAPLYLTRHRLYSAALRRFLSLDPLGLDAGLNFYAYANGDPLAYIDPLGLCAEGSDFWIRFGGFFQLLSGSVEIITGATALAVTAETGIGLVMGGLVVAHGIDALVAGGYKLIIGEEYDTCTSEALQMASIPRDYANIVDAGLSFAGAAVMKTTNVISPAVRFATVDSDGMLTVSRWGTDKSLKMGDWVMKGRVNRVTYWKTGKGQPKWVPGNNTPVPYKQGHEFRVPESMLRLPSGWQVIKAPLGQRIYVGPEIH